MSKNYELARWTATFAADTFVYGEDAGTVARRAVRYHRASVSAARVPTALDLGCGEGQDLTYLARCGYAATGIDFVENALHKAKRLLEKHQLTAKTLQMDLRHWRAEQHYDLVLACNSPQFLGEETPALIDRARDATAEGGVIGLSLFGCEDGEMVQDGVYLTSLERLTERFHNASAGSWQMLETAKLWQWNLQSNTPRLFVTLIAQRK